MNTRNTRSTAGRDGTTGNERYRVTYDSERESVSTAVALAICEVTEVDLADFQLYQYVDPDSLDSLFSPIGNAGRERGRVELFALGHRITITATGEITIRSATPETSAAPETE